MDELALQRRKAWAEENPHSLTTETHVATKLACHFAGDDPPPAMVARLTQSFAISGGDLPSAYRALIASPERG